MAYTNNITEFLGLNLRDRIGQGELAETHNCSSRRYPLLTSRSPRDLKSDIMGPVTACVANNALYFCISGKVNNILNADLYRFEDKTETVVITGWDGGVSNGQWETPSSYGDAYIDNNVVYLEHCGIMSVSKVEWYDSDDNVHEIHSYSVESVNRAGTSDYRDCIKLTLDYAYGEECISVRVTAKTAKLCEHFNGSQDPYQELTTMVGMGAYVLMFPVGFYYNTQTGGNGHIYKSDTITGTIFKCDVNGYGMDCNISTTAPSDHTKYWLDTSGTEDKMMYWEDGSWHEIASDYVCIRASTYGISSAFQEGDSISLTITSGGGNAEIGDTVILKRNDNAILVSGQCLKNASIVVGVERKLPKLDYVCECENRLWGVTEDQNEIYACALGNFLAWNSFQGISTDSYVVSRGCPGKWTGCINYLGTPTFFKENYIECVYPASSGAHQVSTLNINGTGPTAPKSIAMVDNIVYYQGATAFYAYSGSLPKKISLKLAENIYTDSVGGDLAGFYYVSSKDKNGVWHLFVYDVDAQAWYEEDDTHALSMARVNSKLYMFTADGKFFCTTGGDEIVKWYAVTADMGYESYEDRYPVKICVRSSGDVGEDILVYIEYDGDGKWNPIGTLVGKGGHRYSNYPLVPERCDHFRLKFRGKGNSAIWNIDVLYNIGGKTK